MIVSGVYLIHGPAGLYVGQALDCFSRSTVILAERLGLEWGIIREMPNSTKSERMRAEMEIADKWASRGFAIISRNTSPEVTLWHKRRLEWITGHAVLPQTREKIRKSMQGKNLGRKYGADHGRRAAHARWHGQRSRTASKTYRTERT